MFEHFLADASGGGCAPSGRRELPEAGPDARDIEERVAYGQGKGLCRFGGRRWARDHDECCVRMCADGYDPATITTARVWMEWWWMVVVDSWLVGGVVIGGSG